MECSIFVSIKLSFGIFPGHADVVRALIELGANVNAENEDKFTPLLVAASRGTSLTHLLIYFIQNHQVMTEYCFC